jgi:hypothetical protein
MALPCCSPKVFGETPIRLGSFKPAGFQAFEQLSDVRRASAEARSRCIDEGDIGALPQHSRDRAFDSG